MRRRHFCEVALLSVALVAAFGCQRPVEDPGAANKDLVRQFYAAVDKNDFTKLGTLLADDVVIEFAGVPDRLDKKAFLGLVPIVFAAFPDYTHQVDELVAEGDRVAAKVTYHATHKGEYEGIPATGKAVVYNGAHLFTIANGKIRHAWALEDNLALMTQLGMTLAPAPSKK
jgi:steroid delta-isomerase-like uncharacterized protein